jgi:hypothetical protein
VFGESPTGNRSKATTKEQCNSTKLNIYKEIYTEISMIRTKYLVIGSTVGIIQMLSVITVLVGHVFACWKNT